MNDALSCSFLIIDVEFPEGTLFPQIASALPYIIEYSFSLYVICHVSKLDAVSVCNKHTWYITNRSVHRGTIVVMIVW